MSYVHPLQINIRYIEFLAPAINAIVYLEITSHDVSIKNSLSNLGKYLA